MPRQPRRLSPSTTPREAGHSVNPAMPEPYLGSGKNEEDPRQKRDKVKMIGRVSMFDYKVDPLDILKHLTGSTYVADESTGLVSRTRNTSG